MSDLISRQEAFDEIIWNSDNGVIDAKVAIEALRKLPSVEPEPCEDKGEISDGYHTFNQLYHQRAILFAAIVNQNKDISWKSYKHSDGKYCFDSDGEWFVVGIDTPKGSYTYHYSKEYWDYFECKELDCGKEWDGHTEDDVIRLLSLTSVEPERKGRECASCKHSNNGECAFTETCHECMWESQYEQQVEPERKTGKWIEGKKTPGYIKWNCSECGLMVRNPQKPWYEYCPKCGAEMRDVPETNDKGTESEDVK